MAQYNYIYNINENTLDKEFTPASPLDVAYIDIAGLCDNTNNIRVRMEIHFSTALLNIWGNVYYEGGTKGIISSITSKVTIEHMVQDEYEYTHNNITNSGCSFLECNLKGVPYDDRLAFLRLDLSIVLPANGNYESEATYNYSFTIPIKTSTLCPKSPNNIIIGYGIDSSLYIGQNTDISWNYSGMSNVEVLGNEIVGYLVKIEDSTSGNKNNFGSEYYYVDNIPDTYSGKITLPYNTSKHLSSYVWVFIKAVGAQGSKEPTQDGWDHPMNSGSSSSVDITIEPGKVPFIYHNDEWVAGKSYVFTNGRWQVGSAKIL